MNAYIVHRDRGVFGEDAHDFRPERWLGSDAKSMDRYMFQVSDSVIKNSYHSKLYFQSNAYGLCLYPVWRWTVHLYG